MTPRGRRALRVFILATAVLVLAVGGASAYFWVNRPEPVDWDSRRADGMEAAANGNFTRAIKMLGGYVEEHPQDEEAVMVFVQARRQVPEKRGAHLLAGVRVLQQLLADGREHLPARKELMDLYLTGHLFTETVTVANQILERHPNDVDALRAKTLALARMRRLDEALDAADRTLALDAQDLEIHIVALTAMNKLQRPAEQIIERARRYRFANPEDPRFELLNSYAFFLAGDHNEARRWLKSAATRPSPSATFTQVLLPQLDRLGMYDDALRMLELSVTQDYPVEARREYVRRLWQVDRAGEIVAHLSDLDPSNPDADSDLLAMRAMAHFRLDEPVEGDRIVDELETRGGDRVAAAWTAIMRRIIAESTVRPIDAIHTCRAAMADDPRNPYIRYYLGHAYSLIGEKDLAITFWRQAADLAPSWALPYTRIARALTDTGRGHLAIKEGEEALKRDPDSLAAVVATALAWTAMIEAGRAEPNEALIDLLEKLQGQRPRDEATIPAYVSLLAKADRTEEAVDAIDWVISEKSLAGSDTLLELADISRAYGLEAQEKIYDVVVAEYGLTAQLALARALDRLADGRGLEGLRYLNAARQRADNPETVDWDLAIARYQDAMGDTGALATWIAIAEKYPEDLRVQRMALEAPSAQNDRRFMHQTIERVRALTGSDALAWRLARVRWLLNSPNIKRDALQAKYILEQIVFLLPNLVEPKILMGEAEEARGHLSKATHILDLAASLQIQSHGLTLRVADLLWTLGDRQGAINQIRRVVEDPLAKPREIRLAVTLLTDLGATDMALQSLLNLYRRTGERDPSDLQLARLYRQKGMFKETERILEQVLELPTYDSVVFAADYYASRGELSQARAALAKLRNLDIPADRRQFALAEWLRRYDRMDRALEYYEAAVMADPKQARYWHHYIANLLRDQKVKRAVEVSGTAAKALQGDEVINQFLDHSDLAAEMIDNDLTRDLVVGLVLDSAHIDAAVSAMKIVREAAKEEIRLTDYLPDLIRIADRYPRCLAVQDLTIKVALRAGKYEKSFQVASRTRQYYPFEEMPAKMAALSLGSLGRWAEAVEFAREWKFVAVANPVEPDLLLAEAYIHLDTPGTAKRILLPHVQNTDGDPVLRRRAVAMYAIALVAADQIEEAEKLVKPLLRDSIWWRTTWVQIATVWIERPEYATSWLRQVEPFVSERDAFAELLALARGFQLVGEKFDSDPARERALAIASRVANRTDASVEAMLTLAYIAEKRGDKEEAERQYRRILQAQPVHPVAQNNLAMILAERGHQIDHALELAESVVEMYPRNAAYLDTLAYVQARAGKYQDAIDQLEQVIEMDPFTPDWHIHLATVLVDARRFDDLPPVLADLQRLRVPMDELPERVREHIRAYRNPTTHDPYDLLGAATMPPVEAGR